MRAIFIFLLINLFFLSSCTTVEVAKEITKATKSIETSLSKILKTPEEEEKEKKVLDEKKEIIEEQKKIVEVVNKQKKIASIEIINKTMKELDLIIGQPNLIRKDGKTIIGRFDSKNCRLFIFLNSTLKKPLVEYYELRNDQGVLIKEQNNIRSCFKEIKLI